MREVERLVKLFLEENILLKLLENFFFMLNMNVVGDVKVILNFFDIIVLG